MIEIVDLFTPLRCFHASELFSVFDFTVALWGAGEVCQLAGWVVVLVFMLLTLRGCIYCSRGGVQTDMARAFVTYWTNFAVTGDPNGAGVPVWHPWVAGAGGDNIAQISTSAAGVNVTMINGLQEAQCTFWGTHQVPPNVFWG